MPNTLRFINQSRRLNQRLDWGVVAITNGYVSEDRREREGADLRELSRLSLDTHRREVAGAHGTNRYTQKNQCQFRQKSSGHVAISALSQCGRRPGISDAT